MDIRNRPSLTLGRDKFTYYDGMVRIPEGTAPDFKNKSHSITAEVEIGEGDNDGMIVTQGGRFGGWGMYIHEGRPKYVYNLANLERTFIVGEKLDRASTRSATSSSTTVAKASAMVARARSTWMARRWPKNVSIARWAFASHSMRHLTSVRTLVSP